MRAFETVRSVVVPLDRPNVDTDQIIPKQFLVSVKRTGFGDFLFDEWRYEDRGALGDDCSKRPKKAGFVLNDRRYQGVRILLARHNFGCGSSREHAVWALMEYGIRVVIAPSYSDIFSTNAVSNGLLLVTLAEDVIEDLFTLAQQPSPLTVCVDLAAQTITSAAGDSWHFALPADVKNRLLQGLDDIALTLQHADDIVAYEQRRRVLEPWLFPAR